MNSESNKIPLVTVAMPIYNAGAYLRTAVLSIISQTYPNWQLFIIDDGSTDNALDSINDLFDTRIKILRDGKNKGLAARLNEAIDLAEGEYFARMDQDDISYPERFQKQVLALKSDKSLDLVCVKVITISESDQPLGYLPHQSNHNDICAKPWRSFHMPHPTWMGRLAWFRQYRYSPDRPYFCEDQELLLRSYKGSKFGGIPEVLFAYRLRSKSDIHKIRKVRLAILGLQLNQFIQKRYLGFSVLALSNFGLNVVRDFIRSSFGGLYLPHKATPVNESDIDLFKKILTKIRNCGD